MVMSELTGGVDGAGLLVFLGCSMKGRYIDPDQQGDSRLLLNNTYFLRTEFRQGKKTKKMDFGAIVDSFREWTQKFWLNCCRSSYV
jgi:hypothetical protein